MSQNKKLVIINKEKIFGRNNDFYCDNVDMKSIPEGLSENFKTLIIARKSNIKRFHKINLENIEIASNIFTFLLGIFKTFKDKEVNKEHLKINLTGSAGQSLGAFAIKGLKINLFGDANDYVGKGLSGATIVIRPPKNSSLVTNKNTIVGNTVLYGATTGELYVAGQAGERFAVRNSGATTVVEGCGSNGCEYMTGGTVVILGQSGDNFGAGMTGGMAFVYDEDQKFHIRVNPETLLFDQIRSDYWTNELLQIILRHYQNTASQHAKRILDDWKNEKNKSIQVCPKEVVATLPQPLGFEMELEQAN